MSWIKDLLKKNKQTRNVKYLPGVNWPTEKILEHAVRSKLESVTVVGWTKEGQLYLNSTHAKLGDLHWDLVMASKRVVDG